MSSKGMKKVEASVTSGRPDYGPGREERIRSKYGRKPSSNGHVETNGQLLPEPRKKQPTATRRGHKKKRRIVLVSL